MNMRGCVVSIARHPAVPRQLGGEPGGLRLPHPQDPAGLRSHLEARPAGGGVRSPWRPAGGRGGVGLKRTEESFEPVTSAAPSGTFEP